MNKMHLVPVAFAGLVGLTGLTGAITLAVTLDADGAAPAARPAYSGAPTPRHLVGSWSSSRLSTINYRDRTTGSFVPPSGHTISYKIESNGTYELSGLLQSSLYHCTMRVFKWERGVLAVEANQLTLTPREGKVHSQDTCRAGSEKEREVVDPATRYTFSIATEDGREVLVMKKASGEDWGKFYRR